jgi:DNA polymerase/3'-5' exonuclease PolX
MESERMNKKILKEFERAIKCEENAFKSIQLIRTHKKILNLEYEITLENYLGLSKIKGIGSGMIRRIKEILETGEIQGLKPKTPPKWLELTTVHGIGEKGAKKIYEKYGYTTVDDLIKNQDKLDLHHDIQIGLKYYDAFMQRIPRAEFARLETVLDNLSKTEIKINVKICGSYRRLQEDCGDIDILCTSEDPKDFKNLIKYLKTEKIIIDDITPGSTKKYMGVCLLDKIPRRIDIRWVENSQFGPAVLYFTGNFEFNIHMRQIAIDKNLKLNEYGLFKQNGTEIIGKRIKKEVPKWELIPCPDEKDIFKYLEMDYIEPDKRIM